MDANEFETFKSAFKVKERTEEVRKNWRSGTLSEWKTRKIIPVMFKCKCFEWVARHYIVFYCHFNFSRTLIEFNLFPHLIFQPGNSSLRNSKCLHICHFLFFLPLKLCVCVCVCSQLTAIISEHWLNLRCVHLRYFHRWKCKLRRSRIRRFYSIIRCDAFEKLYWNKI